MAFDTSDQEINFVRNGNLDGLIVQNPFMMGYAGVWYGLEAAHGVVLPKTIDSGVHVVTKANIDSPAMQGLLDPKKYQADAVPGREVGHRAPARSRSGTAAAEQGGSGGIRHHLPVETWVARCTVLLWIGLAVASPYFLTAGNVFNIMRQVSVDAIIAYGELFTIITAGIDLSVGSVAGLTGVVFALILAAA